MNSFIHVRTHPIARTDEIADRSLLLPRHSQVVRCSFGVCILWHVQ